MFLNKCELQILLLSFISLHLLFEQNFGHFVQQGLVHKDQLADPIFYYSAPNLSAQTTALTYSQKIVQRSQITYPKWSLVKRIS